MPRPTRVVDPTSRPGPGKRRRKPTPELVAAPRSTGAAARVPALVVDDDAPSAQVISAVLRASGCRVRLASSAEDGLASLRELQPRLIVLDPALPVMSGLLLVRHLKSDPATREIVIIAMTAIAGRQIEVVALEAGCSAFLRKPVDPPSLAELVQLYLPRWRQKGSD
jgi:two-component system cell cycle response regulator DivK